MVNIRMKNYLEFEKEIKQLEQDVENLKSPVGSEGDFRGRYKKLKIFRPIK